MKYIFAFLLFSNVMNAQQTGKQLAGLWEVTGVLVGDDTMTPVAKWMDFRGDQSYFSGNGWVRHTVGTWKLQADKNLLTIDNSNGVKDKYGPFDIRIDGDKMVMAREEDGMGIVVALQRVRELPMSHADKLLGLWKVVEVNDGGMESPVTVNGDVFFVRWDRRYVFQGTGARHTGIWHTDGHRPEVRLLSDNDERYNSTWQIGFSDDLMIWKGDGENGVEIVYRRVQEFGG